mgnify:FL=1|jgi:hypothetical protein
MSEATKFIPPHALNTAVLFLVFNRLDTTKQVFEAIRQAKPPRLYVAADGARANKEGEVDKAQAVRDYIMQNIDWKCEVKTLFQEENLGCKYAVSGAITWFFENEERGIILEDDCLPSQSFFWFCEELLEKYKKDMSVGQISGDNFQNGIQRGLDDYYFSIHNHIWGWATWRNRWKKYDVLLNNIEEPLFLADCFSNLNERKLWESLFYKMKDSKIDTWDYQWSFCLWNENMLTAIPNKNLVKNIGFGSDATHTTIETKFSNLDSHEIMINTHPNRVTQDYEADKYLFKITRPNVVVRIFNKIIRRII